MTGRYVEPATALAIRSYDKGSILRNTPNLVHVLNGPPGQADAVRTLLSDLVASAPGAE